MKTTTNSNTTSKFIQSWIREYRAIFSDTAVIVSFFVISIVVAFAYTYLYSNQVLQELPVVVVDNDATTESRKIIRMIDQTPQVNIAHNATEIGEAKQLFQAQKVKAIIVIPQYFAKDVSRAMQPSLSVYSDASYMLYYKQVFQAIKMAVGYFNAGVEIKKMTAKGMSTVEALRTRQPVNPNVIHLYNSGGGYASFVMPMVYLIIIQTTMLTGIGLLGGTAREKKSLKYRLVHARNKIDTIFITLGKAIAYSSIGFFVMFIILGFTYPMFGIPQRGKVCDILLFLLPGILAIAFLGILLNAFFKHREDAVMTILFTSIPAMLLCGISWPTSEMPLFLQGVSKLVPTTISTKGFIAITQSGADLLTVKDWWLQMWGLCFFYFLLAVLAEKKIENEQKSNKSLPNTRFSGSHF